MLIETACPDRPGSMQRYADLIELALASRSDITVSRRVLAPTAASLNKYPRRFRMLMHHATIAWRAKWFLKGTGADLFHIVDGSHGYLAQWTPRDRSIVTVHDIIPDLQSRNRFAVAPPSTGARWLIRSGIRSLQFAKRIMAVSKCTAHDLREANPILDGRIHVVPLAILPKMLPDQTVMLPDWKSRRSSAMAYILHLGNNGFYKNRAGVVRIFDRIRSTTPCRLILAGPPPDNALRALIHERKLEAAIDFIVDPDDATIAELYRSARMLLFPSYYEGFGWPPLEAMAWGCPVVCSCNGSLPEVVGDAALTAEADAETELAAHGLRVLTDELTAAQLVAAGHAQVKRFSFERFRELLIEVYHSAI